MITINALVLSCGTRNKIIQYFKENLSIYGGKIFGADASRLAPALYECDEFFVVPEFTQDAYIPTILKICEQKNINFLLSLIDTELTIIAENREKFEKIGVRVIGPSHEAATLCLNKKEIFRFLTKHNISTQKSYFSLEEFNIAYQKKEIGFPVFIKPVTGSASIGIQKIESLEELEFIFKITDVELMIQENMDGKEYGVDCYIDINTGKLTDIFIKEKLKMRAGETDKAVSVKNDEIVELVKKFMDKVEGLFGPIDIDIFEKDGNYYLSEVNPRFGGGYPHAYECGINFPANIIQNLNGITPHKMMLDYPVDVYMMKFNDIKIIEENGAKV